MNLLTGASLLALAKSIYYHISLTLRALFCLTLFECYIFFAIERFRITFKVNGKRQIKGENFSKKIVKNKIKNTKK